jgi:hypothetical protein
MRTGEARVRALLAAGLVDSFGLSLGWTTFTLVAVAHGGLSAAGMYNAAMFAGIVASAPVAGWLARRLDGRQLLAGSGAVEMVLRVGTLCALLNGWSSGVISAGVLVMNIAAWTGYAGMRAEVAAAAPGARSMTRYAIAIAAIEAVGASVAALLPAADDTGLGHTVLTAVAIWYGASVIPQFVCARRATVRSGIQVARDPVPVSAVSATRLARTMSRRRSARARLNVLLGGGAVMLIASGPASLNTALAAELYGHRAVMVSAICFSAGCLLAGPAVDRLATVRLSPRAAFVFWGVAMLAGWVAAPWSIAGLLVAQFLSGLSATAFQGEMDSRVAEVAPTRTVTASLAWAASVRATGSAVAVRTLPVFTSAAAIGRFSLGCTAALLAGAVAVVVAARRTPTAAGYPGSSRAPATDADRSTAAA